MNNYRVHKCFVFILAIFILTVQGNSRKKYRNKINSLAQTTKTHLDIDQTVSSSKNSRKRFRKKKDSEQNTIHTYIDTSHLKDFSQAIELSSQILPGEQSNTFENPFTVMDHEKSKPIIKKIEPPIFEEDNNDEDNSIGFNFENAKLTNLAEQIEEIFGITFITDDALNPLPQGRKTLNGHKISFKTHTSLSKKEAWNLFISFLDMAGFALVPYNNDQKIFRITAIESARKSPLTSYIGVDYTILPDSDEIVRYIYFLENASTEAIKAIIDPLRSNSSQGFVELKEHKGFMLTDKSYNIKVLMKIVKELDKASMPESMAILKLRNADAKEVQELYTSLLPKEEPSSRFFTKKQPTSLYFPENARIIAEPRSNILILLGPIDAIKKIENFIVTYIDKELDQAYSPLYTYQLKHADAVTIAEIMNNITSFGKNSEAGKYGGTRNGEQYLGPITFVADKETNKLIIKGSYPDYLKAEKIINELDEAQPQVAIEVLIVSVDINDTKSLGGQLRSKAPGPNGLLGNNIKFQTSGLYGSSPIVTNPPTGDYTPPNPGVDRLLGNLLNLVTSATPGTTLLTLGQDALGIWGIFQALKTITDAEVVSNPFLLATNNTKATVKLGTERRVITSQVIGTSEPTNAFGADDANLEVIITPQINSDGMIVLKVSIELDEFTDPDNPTSATKLQRNITTNAIVANQEVLALGGLIRDNVTSIQSKVPVLGDIPILGWLFKNERKITLKQNLLVLISSRIIRPETDKDAKEFSAYHIADYQETLAHMNPTSQSYDPIYTQFFQDKSIRAQKLDHKEIFINKSIRKKNSKENNEVNNKTINSQLNQPAEKDFIAQNSRKATIQRKKRTELSLSQFLQKTQEEA